MGNLDDLDEIFGSDEPSDDEKTVAEFLPMVDLKKCCSPILLKDMNRPVACIPNDSEGYFALLDKNPLDLDVVKNYRDMQPWEVEEARARYLATL